MGGKWARLLVVAAAVGAVAIPGSATAVAAPAAATAGNCTPGADWGTLQPDLAAQANTLINQHRTSMGLAALKKSPHLTAAADWKSLHMARYQYFGHSDPPAAGCPRTRSSA